MTPTLLVVDDHELLAQSLCYALMARGFDARTSALTDAESLLSSVRSDPPAAILLDIQLGGDIGSGTRLVRPLTEAGARVVVMSGLADPVVVGETLEAGAVGFVSKSEPFDTLVDAAARAAGGREVMPPGRRTEFLAALRDHRTATAAARAPLARLTPREREVLRELCRGHAVSKIAARDYVSVPDRPHPGPRDPAQARGRLPAGGRGPRLPARVV